MAPTACHDDYLNADARPAGVQPLETTLQDKDGVKLTPTIIRKDFNSYIH